MDLDKREREELNRDPLATDGWVIVGRHAGCPYWEVIFSTREDIPMQPTVGIEREKVFIFEKKEEAEYALSQFTIDLHTESAVLSIREWLKPTIKGKEEPPEWIERYKKI